MLSSPRAGRSRRCRDFVRIVHRCQGACELVQNSRRELPAGSETTSSVFGRGFGNGLARTGYSPDMTRCDLPSRQAPVTLTRLLGCPCSGCPLRRPCTDCPWGWPVMSVVGRAPHMLADRIGLPHDLQVKIAEILRSTHPYPTAIHAWPWRSMPVSRRPDTRPFNWRAVPCLTGSSEFAAPAAKRSTSPIGCKGDRSAQRQAGWRP
jgi:hypothetical protein